MYSFIYFCWKGKLHYILLTQNIDISYTNLSNWIIKFENSHNIFLNQVIMGFPHFPYFKRDYFGFYDNEHVLPPWQVYPKYH